MNNLEDLSWVILVLPLLAAVFITLFTQRDGRFSAKLSIGAIVLSFLFTLGLFCVLRENRVANAAALEWLNIGNFRVELGLRLDPLSWIMLLVVQASAVSSISIPTAT